MQEKMKIIRPVLGKITQGTLFNCAVADRYRDKSVHGLAITARCDVANDKYPVLNYLPVVTLLDWMHCDGIEILLGNALKSTNGNFASSLKQAGIAVSLLASIPRQEVVRSFFYSEDANKAQKKLAQAVQEQADRLDRLDGLDLENASDRNWFLNTYTKEVSALVKELVLGKVPSYYYIPSVTDDNEEEGYVILMRESAFLPRRVARQIACGVDRPLSKSSELEMHLSFLHDDFAMPVGQMPSPNIEHVLQTFSFMFGRIGLEDYSAEFISDVCARNFEM